MRASYERDGFVVVRALLDGAAIARALDEAERLHRRQDLISPSNLRCRYQRDLFETFDPVVDLSPAARALALDDRLLQLLGELYGEAACLFKDKLIYKPPACPGYDLHQDWIAWPDFPRSFLTVLVPLDAATCENGCTIVYPGYHHGGSLSLTDGDYHPLAPELVDESRAVPLELQPGDVAVFGGFVPHRSEPNRSSRWRRQLYLSYNRLSEGGHQRDAHYAEFHRWLRERHAKQGKNDLYFK
jgi:ectoine hydroxylase-related dioxygenase (phytanoyl-CoA dioxygenase family)